MKKHSKLTDDDRALFAEATCDVKPITHDKVIHEKKRPKPVARMSQLGELEVIEEMFSDGLEPADIDSGEELYFRRPGVQNNLIRKLRRGHYRLDGELDLHGMTVAEAKLSLSYFLTEARHLGMRNVRIIHGKGRGSKDGRPVLKQKINHWLRQRSEVLAFCSAPLSDGGTGAVYLILKKQ